MFLNVYGCVIFQTIRQALISGLIFLALLSLSLHVADGEGYNAKTKTGTQALLTSTLPSDYPFSGKLQC